jgi:hypothetical protein
LQSAEGFFSVTWINFRFKMDLENILHPGNSGQNSDSTEFAGPLLVEPQRSDWRSDCSIALLLRAIGRRD